MSIQSVSELPIKTVVKPCIEVIFNYFRETQAYARKKKAPIEATGVGPCVSSSPAYRHRKSKLLILSSVAVVPHGYTSNTNPGTSFIVEKSNQVALKFGRRVHFALWRKILKPPIAHFPAI